MRTGKLAALGLAAAVTPMPAGGAQATDSGGDGVHFVPMDEVTVPIVDADRMSGSLRFKLVLDAGTAPMALQVFQEMAKLRATTVATGLEFARLDASGLRAVDAQRLDQQLTAAIRAVEPGIVRVLIVEVGASQR